MLDCSGNTFGRRDGVEERKKGNGIVFVKDCRTVQEATVVKGEVFLVFLQGRSGVFAQ